MRFANGKKIFYSWGISFIECRAYSLLIKMCRNLIGLLISFSSTDNMSFVNMLCSPHINNLSHVKLVGCRWKPCLSRWIFDFYFIFLSLILFKMMAWIMLSTTRQQTSNLNQTQQKSIENVKKKEEKKYI